MCLGVPGKIVEIYETNRSGDGKDRLWGCLARGMFNLRP